MRWRRAPPPPPPPPPPLLDTTLLVTVALGLGLPALFLLANGRPWTEPRSKTAPFLVTKLSWRTLVATAFAKSWRIFVFITAGFAAIDMTLRLILGDAPTASGAHGGGEAGKDESPSLMADVVAYNLVSCAFAAYSSGLGLRVWLGGDAATIGGSALSRLYSSSPSITHLCEVVAAYEGFNIVCVVLLPEYRSSAFISHHAVTFFLGILAQHPWCHYYAVFFFGVANLGSVPLCIGELTNSMHLDQLSGMTKAPFALLFLLLRTAYWPYVSLGFWRDSFQVLTSPATEAKVHSHVAYAALLSANLFLTGMQLHWLHMILAAISEVLAGAGLE